MIKFKLFFKSTEKEEEWIDKVQKSGYTFTGINSFLPAFYYFKRDKEKDKMSINMSYYKYQLLNINQISKTVKLKQLSDGQKQKVKLLVLLSLDKHIIILDEITNALDKKSVDEINVFLQNYIQYYPEKIIINISHDINNIRSLKGNYFLIDNQKICKVDTLDDAISWYLGE